MFDLENQISEWRKQMLAAGIKSPVPLEELEIHLREEIGRQIKSELNEQNAFEIAARQIGRAEILENEFAKSGISILERLKQIIFTFAGIPNYQLATNMNTNSNIEPRWAAYFKAATFAFPAIFIWLFFVIFVFPKLNEICSGAGMTPFSTFQQTPMPFPILASLTFVMIHFTQYAIYIAATIVLVLIILEWRFKNWPRYRRATLNAGIFLLNTLALIGITMMVISVLIAAPALRHVH